MIINHRYYAGIFFLLICFMVAIIYHIYPKVDERHERIGPLKKPPKSSYWNDPQRKKLILFVTPWFDMIQWPSAENTKAFLSFSQSPSGVCPVTNCEITYNMSLFNWSDLIVVHGVDTNTLPAVPILKKLHQIRPQQQRWLWYMHESPMNTGYDVSILNNFFNWTETYRHDSEIFYPYDSYYLKSRPELLHVDNALNKTKMVAWMASNTGVTYRKDIAEELIKFGVQLDMFGAVGYKTSGVCGWSCPDFFKAYKFYLAFENSYCKDYITEKYWNALTRGMVPIVIGGANYSDPNLAIPNSYINALDFNSVKDLADYILYLNQNNTAYNQYFSWKAKYEVGVQASTSHYCSICDKINTNVTSQPETYADFSKFWGPNTCKDLGTLARKKLKVT